ncbi:MAG: hypothetical protein ACOC6K_01950, partial [Thermodesulfobacteriota bacterium]
MIEAALLLVRLVLGVAALTLMGGLLVRWLAPEFNLLEQNAVGFGLGALIITLWMLALSSLGIPFDLPLVLALPLSLVGGLWLGQIVGRRRSHKSQSPPPVPPLPRPDPYTYADWLFLGLLAALFIFAFLRAGLYPMWAWDAIATWGFKAKVFYGREAVDLKGFEAHNYYPNLVPLLLTYLYLWLGQVNDHLVKLVFPLWGAALLGLLFVLLRRLGLNRTRSLGVIAFLALNGVTFITHLHIAYADMALTYFTLGAGGFLYLWLRNDAPRETMPLAAFFFAGLTWCKFEGLPLAGSMLLAAGLTLLWLRPPHLTRRLASLAWPVAGLILGYLPWRLFMASQGIVTGADHILGFYPQQLFQAFPTFLWALGYPTLFGILWPATVVALVLFGRKIFTTPRLFLALFLGGNFLAILLAYAVAPTSPAEFHMYVRATLDRLLLHLTPVAALAIGEGLKEVGGRAGDLR